MDDKQKKLKIDENAAKQSSQNTDTQALSDASMAETPENGKKNLLFFVIFIALWGVLIAWNLFTPVQTFSEAENRVLASFPRFSVETLLDGEYMNAVDTFLNDQFAGRPYWVSGQSLVEYGLGKREMNDTFIGKNALLADLPAEEEEITKQNIQGVNAFAAQYQVPSYALLVPSSTSVQQSKLPPFAEEWDEIEYVKQVNQSFAEGVTPVDVTDVLQQHSEEYIYYRTDHHWTSYGAYLAYTQLAQQLGLPVKTQQDFAPETVSTHFKGTYHSKTGFPLVQADTIEVYQAGEVQSFSVFNGSEEKEYDSIYFPEYLEQKGQYTYFLGQAQPVSTIYTKADTGKKLLLFKDSYAHSFVPMLLAEYSEIKIIDLRHINNATLQEVLQSQTYDEALFLYSADVFAHQKITSKLAVAQG